MIFLSYSRPECSSRITLSHPFLSLTSTEMFVRSSCGWWCSVLRILSCHCGLRHCCGVGWIPGSGNFICCGHGHPSPTRDVCSVILNHPASCRAHVRVDKRAFSYIQIFLDFCYIPDPVPSEERPWQRPPRGPAPAGGLLPSTPGWPSLQPDGGSKWPICEHVPRE